MGLLGNAVHRHTHKEIRRSIDHLRAATRDQRAGTIFHLWLTRGLNLASVSGHPQLNIPVYYYSRGSESPIASLMKQLQGKIDENAISALQRHLYTNLAVSYPQSNYEALVREMWNALWDNHTNLAEVVSAFRPIVESAAMQKIIANNDVSMNTLIDEPKSITPHFLVPGHPLTKSQLDMERAFG